MPPDAAALVLSQRIRDLGARRDYPGLAAIRDDPATGPLLDTLPAPDRERAEFFLQRVDRRLESERRTARRRIDEARAALDHFDLDLARAILSRVDDRVLDGAERDERDRLILDVSARTMEAESLDAVAARVLEEASPPRRRRLRRR